MLARNRRGARFFGNGCEPGRGVLFTVLAKREQRVRNPWLKKNPFLSMWLSGANSIAGSIRGHATAHAKRQINKAVREATRANLELWSNAAKGTTAKPRTKRKR